MMKTDTESSRKLREDFARSCFECLLQFSFLGPKGNPHLFIQTPVVSSSLAPSANVAPFIPTAVNSNRNNTSAGLNYVMEVGLVNRLAVTSLLQRFNEVVVKYVEDEKLSGKCPLPRHRVAEISFVLKALATLISSLKKAPTDTGLFHSIHMYHMD